ncbi:hypothetical protein GR223_29340 [Rhizobium leguminosarum]|uniref:hypothetical protein n=1 Tax=Rhizobium ruizarguesonis TaxID=2081791 RepID=UPI0013E0DA85|nr:hypothetical protein [Rhizobium ruizarguesonis]NEJ89999.1 hypothetical protein [Rhizobium ruizarguesonis]
MAVENPDLPSIAGCLRRIVVGDRANATGSTLWWFDALNTFCKAEGLRNSAGKLNPFGSAIRILDRRRR